MAAIDQPCPICLSLPGEQCKEGPSDQFRYIETIHADRQMRVADSDAPVGDLAAGSMADDASPA